MNNIFGQDGMVYRIINKMVDLILLNVIFLVTCVPIVTVGAATVSLYSVTLKMCKNEESYLFKSFFKYFKENFKKATLIWGIIVLIVSVLTMDFFILKMWNPQLVKILNILAVALLLLVVMIGSYVFPLTARFENTIGNTLKNAVIISMTRIVYTAPITVLNLLPVCLMFFGGKPLLYGIRIYVMVGFSLVAYVNSFIFQIVFKRYEG